jgi:hypothetical protein
MNQPHLTHYSLLRTAVLEHVQKFWPNSTVLEEKWDEGPIEESLPGFRILKVRSRTSGRPAIYVTNGCFAVESPGHIRLEFFLISPEERSQHVETLTMLANFYADERYRLDVGSVASIGDPWMPGSKCDHLLISVPYPYGPKLEWLQVEQNCVRFLWALPITQREAAFVELNGLEALEQKFAAAKLDYLDPFRASII